MLTSFKAWKRLRKYFTSQIALLKRNTLQSAGYSFKYGREESILNFASLGQDFPALRLSSNLPSLLRHFSSLHSESAYAKFAQTPYKASP